MSQGVDKLQVWEATKTAYESIWLHRRRLAGWAVVPVLLTVVIELLFQPYIAGLDAIVAGDPTAQWLSGAVAAGQLRNVLEIAVWSWLELSCYRLFLLGPGDVLPASQRRAIYVSLLVFNLALLAFHSAPTVALDYVLVTGLLTETDLLSFGFFAIYLFVSVRLAFTFPAICMGWPWDLRQRWAETEGHFWRLLLVLMLAFVPVFVLALVFSAFGLDVWSYELSEGAPRLVEAVARGVVNLVSLLTGTAVTVAALAQLTGYNASGMTGQGPGPREIAARFD